MKQLLIAVLAMTAITAHATSMEKVAEITQGVFITLTDITCTMYEAPPNVLLFQAYGEDTSINQKAEGCYSVEQDGMVSINLVNTKNNNQYGYVLPQGLFKDKEK